MSTFIELLRQHHRALKHHYHAQLNGDMHRAIGAMLRCKTRLLWLKSGGQEC
ncbi:hypothetical protein BCU36_025260 [Vibrio lentus]|uniref:hypothetical protein n=1 Tax=Vibrio lentus TaxID=136468 RepID=UPI0039A56665